ncbi:MAG: glycosyltransferase [Paramuribaculum sp.]|nr:glycosyltransferase [Paramuribaculum sp.]
MTQAPEKSTVVVLTESYPFVRSSERAFFEPEIESLACTFDNVIIMPRNRRDDISTLSAPSNVTVSTAWVDHKDRRMRWRRLRFAPQAWMTGKVATETHRKRSLTFGMSAIAMSRFLDRWMTENAMNPDTTLFYTFWFDYSTAALAFLKQKRKDLRIVTRVHSYDETSPVGRRWKTMTSTMLDGVFPVSLHSLELFKECVESGSLPSLTEVNLLGCPDLLQTKGEKTDGTIKIFTACRLDGEKWLDRMLEFIDALATAREERIIWIVAGGGNEEKRFKNSAEQNSNSNLTIDLRGQIDNKTVHEIYDRESIDWAFLLSPAEGLPIALCEALMHGVPAVANDVGGISEIITDDTGVLLAADPEKEEFVRGIAPWLDSPYRYRLLAEGARAFAKENLDSSSLRGRFAKRIRSLL